MPGENDDGQPPEPVPSQNPGSTYGRRAFLLGASAVIVGACSDTEADTEGDAGAEAEGNAGADTGGDTGAETPSTSAQSATSTSTSTSSSATIGEDLDALTPAMFEALPTCALTPSAGAGPFPSRQLLDRRVVHDDYPGHPLRLGVRVVDADCQPVPGAVVDIWHTDASGDYSDFEDGGNGKDEGPGTTFCRGAQTADANGILEFETIYPGWYPDRAIHIHATVHLDNNDVLTTQLYFDEAYTETVLAEGEYAQFGSPQTTWANDSLIDDPAVDGTGISLAPGTTGLGQGTLGLINLGIDRA